MMRSSFDFYLINLECERSSKEKRKEKKETTRKSYKSINETQVEDVMVDVFGMMSVGFGLCFYVL